MDKKLIALLNDNFDRYKVYMNKSFKVKKSRLIEVEAKIRSVVGNEPDYVKIVNRCCANVVQIWVLKKLRY